MPNELSPFRFIGGPCDGAVVPWRLAAHPWLVIRLTEAGQVVSERAHCYVAANGRFGYAGHRGAISAGPPDAAEVVSALAVLGLKIGD